jgi:two-component system, sensor histidine kinase and response regulator
MDQKNSVLVVDDEPHGFDVIEAHLYREGYDLTYVPSGIEALSCLNTIKPDVILLDVMMPQIDGIEVCRKIKSNPQQKHIPIIMVTALNSKEDLARSFEAGADDFLTKPVSGIELRARVRSMLRIKQQYDALQATLHLREDLSNMIVHDLRNPLSKIIAGGTFLLESDLNEEDLKDVQLILSAGRQLNSLVNDLLLLTKMESGKMLLNPIEVDLNKLAMTALSEFAGVAASKEINLKSQLAEQVNPVYVDANLLGRVFDNLLSNALKFSPRQTTITLIVDYLESKVEEVGEEKHRDSASTNVSVMNICSTIVPPKQVMIRLFDEGPGITEDLKQRIFDKYEVGRIMSGFSQFGLGLAFCKMVVEAHNGTIFVEANQPCGSIFTVVL